MSAKFEWDQLVAVAELLLAESVQATESEAFARKSISASYYACFHMVKDTMRAADQSMTENDMNHEPLIAYLLRQKSKHPGLRKIRQELDILRKHRIESDYKNGLTKTTKNAEVDLELCRSILLKVEALPSTF